MPGAREAPGMRPHLRSLRTIMPAAMEPNPNMPRKGSGEAVCGRRPDFDFDPLEVVAAAPWSDEEEDWPLVADDPCVPCVVSAGEAVPVVEPVVPVDVWFWSGEVAVLWLEVDGLLPVVELLPVLLVCAQAMAPPSTSMAAKRKSLFISASPIGVGFSG